jgi:RNA polymerase sigma-70 factor, ECF subfamily
MSAAMLVLASAFRPLPEPDPDLELVSAVKNGDGAKFRELYRRHVDGVYARLTRLIGPVAEREDLLQHIFLDVHRAIPRFRGDSAFRTFLYRIVVNVAYEHLRRRRRAEPLSEERLAELVDPAATPEAAARVRQELARLFELLGRIKPKKRIAFVLVAVEGLSYDEAAAMVDAQPPAVKQRVLAARHELDAMIARQERPS